MVSVSLVSRFRPSFLDAKGDIAVTVATTTATKSNSIHDVSAWPSIQVDATRAASQLKNRAKKIIHALCGNTIGHYAASMPAPLSPKIFLRHWFIATFVMFPCVYARSHAASLLFCAKMTLGSG